MVTDGELNRALNAISVTLNDQRMPRFERDRVQEIVSGALGGGRELVAAVDEGSGGVRGGLVEGDDRVATVRLEQGTWKVERHRGVSDTPAYVPEA